MAKYRFVQVQFWQDDFILALIPEDKYFYLYLLTNTKSNQLGCYGLPKRMIEFETGYNRETVDKLIERFEGYGKIKYSEETNEVLINNWWRHNWTKSPKVETCILKEFEQVEDIEFKEELHSLLIEYGYSIDSLSIDLGEKEKIKKKKEKSNNNNSPSKKDDIPYEEIIQYLNSKADKRFRHSTPKNKELIKARWNEGFRIEDFKKVIDNKVAEWLDDEHFNQYIRPSTLFGTKFEGYLNQKPISGSKSKIEVIDSDREKRKEFIEAKLKRRRELLNEGIN